MRKNNLPIKSGFTIVELLIVIVIIGILAAISIVAYSNISNKATEATLQSDLNNGSKQLEIANITAGGYPGALPSDTQASSGNTLYYSQTGSGSGYCLTASSPRSNTKSYYTSDSQGVTEGSCPGHPAGGSGAISHGSVIQDITSANCPATRTRAVDARDNHSYWVQKLADGKCWMLTSLAYAGGGTTTHGDTKTLTTGGSATFTQPKYYVPPGANPTSGATNPSTATNGTGQYGYLYNWCGAMGGQSGACAPEGTFSLPSVNATTSVCPAGWRLPTGGTGGEFSSLAIAYGATGSYASGGPSPSNWLGNPFMVVFSGIRASGFSAQGTSGSLWSSTPGPSNTDTAYMLTYMSFEYNPSGDADNYNIARGVRCLAS